MTNTMSNTTNIINRIIDDIHKNVEDEIIFYYNKNYINYKELINSFHLFIIEDENILSYIEYNMDVLLYMSKKTRGCNNISSIVNNFRKRIIRSYLLTKRNTIKNVLELLY